MQKPVSWNTYQHFKLEAKSNIERYCNIFDGFAPLFILDWLERTDGFISNSWNDCFAWCFVGMGDKPCLVYNQYRDV